MTARRTEKGERGAGWIVAYNIALLDDEQHQLNSTREQVERLLEKEGVASAVMAYHGAFDMPALTFDAYLLDVSMPGMDGLTLAGRIRATGSTAPIIFITGIESRVFEAIRHQPLRFVRKSHMAQELPEAIHALCAQLRAEEQTALPLQTEGMLVRVPVSHILYVESSDKVQQVVLRDHKYEVRSTMAYFEDQLLNCGFCRIHRCFLVNMQALYSIDGMDAVLSDGTRLPVSRLKIAQVKEEFKRMMFSA